MTSRGAKERRATHNWTNTPTAMLAAFLGHGIARAPTRNKSQASPLTSLRFVPSLFSAKRSRASDGDPNAIYRPLHAPISGRTDFFGFFSFYFLSLPNFVGNAFFQLCLLFSEFQKWNSMKCKGNSSGINMG